MSGGLLALVAQSGLAVVALRSLWRSVYPSAAVMRQPGVVLDIWAPVVIVLPLCVAAARTRDSLGGTALVALSAPIVCGWLALGAALFANVRPGRHVPPWAAVVCGLTGLVLLLLGAAHEMHVWIGQCAFALFAVLLWINTPSLHSQDESPQVLVRASVGIAVAVAAALGQGVMAWLASERTAPVSCGLLVAYAVMGVAAAPLAGSGAALRVGGWVATCGVLLGLGAMSLARLVPAALGLAGGRPASGRSVAAGFEVLALESVALMVLGPVLILVAGLPRPVQRWAGGSIVLLACGRAAWRSAGA